MGLFENVQAYGPYTFAGAPVAGNNEIQTLTTSGTVTAGTFRLSFGGVLAAALNWNATTAQVETALNNLVNIANGGTSSVGVAVTGGAFPGTAFTVTFSGTNMIQQTFPLIVLASNSLTGGGTVVIARSQTGVQTTYRGAMKGALLIDTTNGALYQNTTAPEVPTWTSR